MRRTGDGIDPLGVADVREEICKTKYTRIPFFSSVGGRNLCTTCYKLTGC